MSRCHICEGESRRVFQKYEHWVLECAACQHRFCDLVPAQDHAANIYADSYFSEGGAGYTDYLGEADLLISHGRRYGRLLSRHTQPGKVLDVGAAAGFILKGLEEFGWQGLGIEPNPRMAEYGRTHTGVNVQAGTLEDFHADELFDLVSMVQVVAHFNDLHRAFQNAANMTRPGGYWLIETWNKDSFVARALGENWHEYSPPSVLHWFSPQTLNRLAGQFGFTLVAKGRPEKWLKGEHAKSLVRYKLEDLGMVGQLGKPLVNLVPDGFNIPYPTFDLFWALYRKTA